VDEGGFQLKLPDDAADDGEKRSGVCEWGIVRQSNVIIDGGSLGGTGWLAGSEDSGTAVAAEVGSLFCRQI
jgi:hypothetical protein